VKQRQRAFGHHHVTRRPETDRRVTIWLAMRQLIRFDIPTLVMTTESAKSGIAVFVYKLSRAGYLRKQRIPTGKGLRGCKFIWQLVRDTGPKPPITRRNGNVRDQNTGKEYAPGGAEVIDQGESDAEAP
jgi:hypothetical protein